MTYYNGENFDELVSNGLFLIDFYADWCGPCKMLSSVLEEAQNEINIIKVNTDIYPNLASRFKVMSIPHLVFMKNGKEISYTVGFMDKETLLDKINEIKNI